MAQLELASLLVAAPASGTTGATSNTLPSEVGAETAGTALSFSQLLAGTAQSSTQPLAPGQIAGELAAGPTVNNLPLPTSTPAANDPANVPQANQTLALEALVEGLVPATDGDAGTSDSKPGKLDSETIDVPSDENAAEAAWLGWPLFLESRAALRDGNTLSTQEQMPSPSTEISLTDSTLEGISSSSTQLAPWTQWAQSNTASTDSPENSASSLIQLQQKTIIPDYQGHAATTPLLEPVPTISTGVDSLVSAAPTKGILADSLPVSLANQTGFNAGDMLRATDTSVDLAQTSLASTDPTRHQIVPDPSVLGGSPTAAITKPASTSVLSGVVSSTPNAPTPSSADVTASLKAATPAQSPTLGITVSTAATPITVMAEPVLTNPAASPTGQLLDSAATAEQIDWQRRLAQSLSRTRQSGTAELPSASGDSLKSLATLMTKASLDNAAHTATGADGTATQPTVTAHGLRSEAKPIAGAELQQRSLFTTPIAASRTQPLTTELTTPLTDMEMDDSAPREITAAANKRVQAADSSPAMVDSESVTSVSLEARRNSSAAVTPSVTTSERAADNGAMARMAEPTPTAATPLTRVDSSSATPLRPTTPNTPTTALPTAPDILDMQQKNWERTLARQLDWAVNNRFQEAEIKVNPPDLGPLEMRLTLHHNQTNVMFFSHEAAVREALETALPRLRELLDGQGITLNQAQVSDQSLARHQAGAGEQSGYGQRERNRMPLPTDAEVPVETAQPRNRSQNLRGAVDDYA